MKSIDFAQSRANKQVPPLINSSQKPAQIKDKTNLSKDFLEELGVNNQQFKTLFENLPQGVAVHKMIYNKKGKPVSYIPLESNKIYDNIHFFKPVRIGKKQLNSIQN